MTRRERPPRIGALRLVAIVVGMSEENAAALSRIGTELDGIAQDHGARLEQTTLPDGLIVRSIETEEKAVRAEGHSDLEAASHLLRNAKAEGWA